MNQHVEGEVKAKEEKKDGDEGGKFYTFFVDDREFRVDEPVITGAKIMELAGIDPKVGLNLIKEDGTQEQVQPTDEFELKPGRRFKKAPRFQRG